jgi:hypothetical protein
MLRTLSAMAGLAALAAAAMISFPGSLVQASAPAPVEKSDRADAVGCELRDWPYYRSGCMRDESRNAGRAQRVRVVTTDRIEVNRLAEHSPAPREVETTNAISAAQRLSQVSHRVATETVEGDLTGNFAWPMSNGELRTYLSAGDFVRRTVR